MARSFDGAGDYLRNSASAAVTGYPCTLHAWFKPGATPGSGADFAILSAVKSSALEEFWISYFNDVTLGVNIRAVAQGGGTNRIRYKTQTLTVGTWYAITAVFTSNAASEIYVDAVAGSAYWPSSANTTPTGLTDTYVGAFHYNTSNLYADTNGTIAEAAMWSAALGAEEITSLANGYSPMLVRPGSLAGYWPLLGRTTDEEDWVGGRLLTTTNATAAEHPRVIRATSRGRVYFGQASSNTTVSPTVGSIIVAGSAPTVKQNILRQPTVGSVVVTGNAPTLKTNTIRQPAAGSVIVAGNAPAVVTGGDKVVNPNTGTIVVSGLAPTLKVNTIRQPTVGSVVVAGAAPTVRQGVVRLPTVGSIVVAGLAPTVSYTSHVVRTPSAGTITVAGNAPEIIGASIWTNVSAASTIWTNASAASTTWTNQ